MTGNPRVMVRGEAVAEVPPDSADLVVTLEVRDRRRERAVARLAERQQELTGLLEQHRDVLGAVSADAVSVFPASHGTRVTGSIATTTTRARAYAGALGCRLTGLVEVRDAGVRGGGPAPVALALAASAPSLDLQPALQHVRGAVEVTITMSEPDQEVHQR